MRALVIPLIAEAYVSSMSRPAAAQTILGSVIDASGTPVPGVSVTARSPALIERTRTAITNDRGQYRIDALRPGIYEVVFSHPGMRSFVRDGLELTSTLTITIDAELTTGDAAETITVTGASPIVDIHSPSHETTFSGEFGGSLPTVRGYSGLVMLVPGVVTNTNDVVTGAATTQFPIHGGRSTEGRLLIDGLNLGSPPTGGSPTTYSMDVANAEVVSVAAANGLGESETAGLVMNVIPKTGGNLTHGSAYASGTGRHLQSDNLTPALRLQGVTAATPLTRVYDLSVSLGGPILRNRLWFFVNAHAGGSMKEDANVYYNLNAGDATQWLYSPDFNRREYSDRTFDNASGRLTWQATPRNKFGAFWDVQSLCRACTGATPGLSEPARVAPEAVGVLGRPLQVVQTTWSSPISSQLLVDAGFGSTYFGVGNFERRPNPTRGLIRVAEQCASGCAANGNIPGLVYRSQDFSSAYTGSYLWKASLSYVKGMQSLKLGYQQAFMTDDRSWMTNDEDLAYRLNNGVPNQLTESIAPWVNNTRAGWAAVFVQEQWTRRRLTLQAALRFDRARSWFPEQQEGPSRFLPDPIVVPKTNGVDSYKDLSPRIGAAYDLLGNGRTALRMNVGRYLDGVGTSGIYANTNPTLRMPQTTSTFGPAGVTRAWTDANNNFVPDCDLLNPAAQDLRAAGGDMCGVVSNTNFGRNVFTNNFDPAILNGWGVRPSDWSLEISLQHQIGPQASVSVSYNRRWFRGFVAADNQSIGPSDLTRFSVVAPLDPRLPEGGGYVISDLYDVTPEKSGQVNNLITDSSKYGAWYQYFNGVDATVDMRSAHGLTLIGGVSIGQTVADNCAVRANLPELATTATGTSAFGAGLLGSAVTPVSPYCHVAFGFLPQLRGGSAYVVSSIDVQLSATFQSKPGPMLAANYAVPNADIAPVLGRNLSGNAANVTVNLIQPGTMYGDRINQLDIRVAKILRRGRTRTVLALDTYNALNSSAVLAYNNAFVPGATWLQPTSVLTPRFFRLTAELEF